MSEIPADWLDQAAKRAAEEQARASTLGTNTTPAAQNPPVTDPRTVLRDRIAELAQREYRSSITTAGTVAHAEYLGARIAVDVMELFVDVRRSEWLRAGYVIAELTERDNDWMCGAYQPASRNPYRCTEPADHPGAHLAAVDGAIAAQWSRIPSAGSETP